MGVFSARSGLLELDFEETGSLHDIVSGPDQINRVVNGFLAAHPQAFQWAVMFFAPESAFDAASDTIVFFEFGSSLVSSPVGDAQILFGMFELIVVFAAFLNGAIFQTRAISADFGVEKSASFAVFELFFQRTAFEGAADDAVLGVELEILQRPHNAMLLNTCVESRRCLSTQIPSS